MRSKIAVVGFMVLAGAVARDNRASACLITDADTDSADLQIFNCQGNPNPLTDPITGQFDPRPSIFFARYGRDPVSPIPPSCDTSQTMLTALPMVPFPDCSVVPCPNAGAIQGTGLSQWSFYIQDDDRWHLDNNEWSANGKSDTVFYNVNQPYSKMLNTAYLVWFGIKDDVTKVFHGTQDYVNLLRANDSDFHSPFFRSVRESGGYNGFWEGNVGDDEAWLGCHEFDSSFEGVNNNIVFRLGTSIHEAWHAWENWWIEGGSVPHLVAANLTECQAPNTCNCSVPDAACDRFNAHAVGSYPFGTLAPGKSFGPGCPFPPRNCAGTILNHHTPNQIKWEYMCDLIVSPADWVTPDLTSKAQMAQDLTAPYFVQMPPAQCGSNHPMMGAM
jgi:hypothetical protein